jgi:hypothetical protein
VCNVDLGLRFLLHCESFRRESAGHDTENDRSPQEHIV